MVWRDVFEKALEDSRGILSRRTACSTTAGARSTVSCTDRSRAIWTTSARCWRIEELSCRRSTRSCKRSRTAQARRTSACRSAATATIRRHRAAALPGNSVAGRAQAVYQGQRPPGVGRGDRRPAEPAHRAGHREPCLAEAFRPRDRGHAQQLRADGRAALAPRAARLPGGALVEKHMVDQSAAPRDHAVGDIQLSAKRRPRTRR